MISRREFLGATAGALAAPLLPGLAGAAAAPWPIVDTHTHFYDPSRPQGVPWPPPGDALLYRRVLPPEYVELARPLGITGTVVVEASPWVEDNQWLLDLAEREPFLLGIVGNLDPLSPDFAQHLARFTRNPRFLGIRVGGRQILTHGKEAAFLDAMKRLADSGRSLDINGPSAYLAALPALVAAVPGLRVIADHAGSPGDPQALTEEWRKSIAALAPVPAVVCKVSGLPEQARSRRKAGGEGGAVVGEGAPTEMHYYRPVLDALLEAFGEERLIFGSNWPVSNKGTSLPNVVRISRDYFATKGERACQRVFAENARAFYRWPAR